MKDSCRFVDVGVVVSLTPSERSVKLRANHFPSKLGGNPAWMVPLDLPGQILCPTCSNKCRFIGQLYAPREPEAYHRTIYIFLCGNLAFCPRSSGCGVALRCQLPQENEFYYEDYGDSATENIKEEYFDLFSSLYKTQMCDGDKIYEECFVEVVEEEVVDSDSSSGSDQEEDFSTRNRDYLRFCRKVESQAGQVVRYSRGNPLWISGERIGDVPCCELCGGDREFEFQVTPQSIAYLKGSESWRMLDFGGLYVYTCKHSCEMRHLGINYTNEVIFVMDFT